MANDYSILGRNGEQYDISSTVVQGGSAVTALAKFDAYATELGLTPANATLPLTNGDDEVYYQTTSAAYAEFINSYMLSTEGGVAFYDADPPSKSKSSITLPNVNRMIITASPPNLMFIFHLPGSDLKSFDSKYIGNENGYVLFIKHSFYAGGTEYHVAIKVTPENMKFYFQKVSVEVTTIPLYAVTFGELNNELIQQTEIATLFNNESYQTEVTVTNQEASGGSGDGDTSSIKFYYHPL